MNRRELFAAITGAFLIAKQKPAPVVSPVIETAKANVPKPFDSFPAGNVTTSLFDPLDPHTRIGGGTYLQEPFIYSTGDTLNPFRSYDCLRK